MQQSYQSDGNHSAILRSLLHERIGFKMTDPASVHNSAIVIDTHADTPQRFADENWNFTDPLNGGMLNYDSAKKGNLTAEFFAMWVDPGQYPADASARRTLALIEATLEQVRRAPEKLQLCTSAEDILNARAQGRFAVLMGIEGGHSIENSLALLRDYYRLGVRYMTLTWSNSNDWADSSGDLDDPTIPHHNGLTPFGKDVIREMNRLGMMIDISHASDKTFQDVIETTNAPIIASHSSSRTLTDSLRNLTDEMLVAIGRNRGVVMVNFFSAFIDEDWRVAWNAQRPERKIIHQAVESDYKAKGIPVPYSVSSKIDREFAAKIGRAPLNSLIDHLDQIIKFAGIDHVGIGTDTDLEPDVQRTYTNAIWKGEIRGFFPAVAAEMLKAGFSPEEAGKIGG